MLGELEPCTLVGETGMFPKQMDPFAVSQTKIVLPDKVFRLSTGKMLWWITLCVQHVRQIEDFNFQDSYHCVVISAQGREMAVLSQERPLQPHGIVLVSGRSGYWSCMMKQGNITCVTLGLGSTKGSQAKVFCCTLGFFFFFFPPKLYLTL